MGLTFDDVRLRSYMELCILIPGLSSHHHQGSHTFEHVSVILSLFFLKQFHGFFFFFCNLRPQSDCFSERTPCFSCLQSVGPRH